MWYILPYVIQQQKWMHIVQMWSIVTAIMALNAHGYPVILYFSSVRYLSSSWYLSIESSLLWCTNLSLRRGNKRDLVRPKTGYSEPPVSIHSKISLFIFTLTTNAMFYIGYTLCSIRLIFVFIVVLEEDLICLGPILIVYHPSFLK